MQVPVPQVYGFDDGLTLDGADFHGHTGGFLRRHSGVVRDPAQEPCAQQNQQRRSGDSSTSHSVLPSQEGSREKEPKGRH